LRNPHQLPLLQLHDHGKEFKLMLIPQTRSLLLR
jgi:hypothetical protein